jgi:hypothetical protein
MVDGECGTGLRSSEGIDFLVEMGDYIPSTQFPVVLGVSTLWEVYDA